MNESDLALFAHEALMVMLKISTPVLVTGLVIGLVVSMLQALTQINEATLVFIPKLLGICAVLALLGSFMLGTLEDYSRTIFDQVIVVGRT